MQYAYFLHISFLSNKNRTQHNVWQKELKIWQNYNTEPQKAENLKDLHLSDTYNIFSYPIWYNIIWHFY